MVVVSAWEPWRRPDAANLVLREQLSRLAGRHEISVLAAGADRSVGDVPAAALAELPNLDLEWFGTARSAGLDRLARLAWSWRTREPAHVRYVARPQLMAVLRRRAASGVDVLHLHGWGTAGLWRAAPSVPTIHAAIDPWAVNLRNRRVGTAARLSDIGQRTLIQRHERRHYPRHRAVVVVTGSDAARVRRLAPAARVDVVPNGVDLGAEPQPVPDVATLGFHGAFESQANVDAARTLVRDVLPRVRTALPQVRVLLAGRQPPPEIRRMADASVDVMADVDDVRTALDVMSVHVDWFTSGAGLKNKVLEAMAAGRPVVTNQLGSAGIGEGDGVAVAPDLDAAAAEIVRLLRDRGLLAAVGRAGRRRAASEFSWDANADRLDQLWHEAAGR